MRLSRAPTTSAIVERYDLCGQSVALSYTKARREAGLWRPGPRGPDSNRHLSDGQAVALPVELPRGRARRCSDRTDAAQDGQFGRPVCPGRGEHSPALVLRNVPRLRVASIRAPGRPKRDKASEDHETYADNEDVDPESHREEDDNEDRHNQHAPNAERSLRVTRVPGEELHQTCQAGLHNTQAM